MKKVALAILLLVVINTLGFSQSGTIKGQLVDFVTSQPISDKAIIVYGTTNGVQTDKEGKFELKNLKFTTTEINIQGGQVIGESQNNIVNYFSTSVRNIDLNRKNKTIDLGVIYLVEKNSSDLVAQIPCKILAENKFKYQLVDGSDRYIDGQHVLIDFSKNSESCNK